MKFLIKTAVDLKHTKEVAKEVTKLYKDYGFDITFDVEDIVLDLNNELLYDTEYTWSFLKRNAVKTIKWAVVYAFHKPNYDGTALFVDCKKSLHDKKIRGQYSRTNDIGLIEVYSDLCYIKKEYINGETFYSNRKRKTDLKHDTFVLFHEVAHHLEQNLGMDGLHKAELKDVQGIYIETLITLLKKKIYPIAKWKTAVTQVYGNVDWKLYQKTGKHRGVDHSAPLNTPIYAPYDGYVRNIENDYKDLGLYALFSFEKDGANYTFLFAHLSRVDVVGKVKAGTVIAHTGNTGKSTAPHLHTELWKGLVIDRNKISTKTIDPMKFIV